MLEVDTKIGPSKIAGIGLFADEVIPKGTVVWKYEPHFDILMSKEEVERLSKPAQKQFHNYAFLDKKYNKYLLCADDARFLNHSTTPNCDDHINDITVAIRDIERGEELTVNYRTFYADLDDHPEIN